MYVGICDDDLQSLSHITELIRAQSCSVPVEIVPFHTLQQLGQYQQKLDVLFLDIEVGQDNSLDYLAQTENTPHTPTIVLVSSHPCYVTRSYQVSVFQFLLKPLQPDIFAKVFADCQKYYHKMQQYCDVKDASGRGWLLPLRQIVYITCKQRRIIYYDSELKLYYSTEPSLLVALNRLKPFGFCQIHKSCLVNLPFVVGIDEVGITVQLKQKTGKLPVGKKYLEEVRQQHLHYLVSKEEV